jgi:hypothetical protein
MSNTDSKTSLLPLPANAKEAQDWSADENYTNSCHLSQIEAIAGKTIDDVLEERGLTSPDDPKPTVRTKNQKAASKRISQAIERKKKADMAPKEATLKAKESTVKPNDKSKEEFTTNAKWVADNKAILFPDDPNRTMSVVATEHPLHGMAAPLGLLQRNMRLIKYMNLEKLSGYADAVTVCCFEVIGKTDKPGVEIGSNLTSLGGMAWIALHHSDPAIRAAFLHTLRKETRFGTAKKLLK